jgi:hypothetical protein
LYRVAEEAVKAIVVALDLEGVKEALRGVGGQLNSWMMLSGVLGLS